MTGIGITGWGLAVPRRTLTNAELAERFGLDEGWIERRTGIGARRVIGPGESTASLAVNAGRQALASAGLSPSDVRHLIVATATPEQLCPATSAFVQHALGLTATAAFDLNAECAGAVYAFVVAAGLMAIDPGPVLVIGSDTHSTVVNPADRDVAVLLGDGAGAVVLEPTATSWLLTWDLGCDGAFQDLLYMPAGGSRRPTSAATVAAGEHTLRMNGRQIYWNAVRCTVESAKATLERAKVGPGDVDVVIPHQANVRILRSIAEHLDVPYERFIVNLDRFGNTSSGSIPIALAEAADDGRLRPGQLVLLAGFGAGMTWASALLRWGG